MAGPTFGQTAGMLSFQGVLKDVNGAVVNGPVTLQFRIYDAYLVDMDRDGDVDRSDFLTFADCYNGSDRAPVCQWH